MTNDRYDVLCDVIADWLETHKGLTKAKIKYAGVSTPKAARTSILRRRPIRWRTRRQSAVRLLPLGPRAELAARYTGGKADQAFHARVRADRFDLLREWVLVFDPRSRHLYSAQDRANVLMAIAMAAQRIADNG